MKTAVGLKPADRAVSWTHRIQSTLHETGCRQGPPRCGSRGQSVGGGGGSTGWWHGLGEGPAGLRGPPCCVGQPDPEMPASCPDAWVQCSSAHSEDTQAG